MVVRVVVVVVLMMMMMMMAHVVIQGVVVVVVLIRGSDGGVAEQRLKRIWIGMVVVMGMMMAAVKGAERVRVRVRVVGMVSEMVVRRRLADDLRVDRLVVVGHGGVVGVAAGVGVVLVVRVKAAAVRLVLQHRVMAPWHGGGLPRHAQAARRVQHLRGRHDGHGGWVGKGHGRGRHCKR